MTPPDHGAAAPPGHDPSRRAFLKGLGIAAGTVAVLPSVGRAQDTKEAAPAPDAEVDGLRELGRGAREVTLRINGKEQRVSVEPRTTLLEALRSKLDLTGAKEVCDRAACGACTVLVDGKVTTACMTLAIDMAGHEITTVEGIAADPRHAKLIDAFCEHDAAQCGFCIPGFVVSSAALLTANPAASPAEIRAALSGNTCRCGTYAKIFEAVESVAKGGAA